ncbi:MAG TPA: aminotransferase class V-fold PLP-dependent enzyme [Terriglobales bacterium]|nr:aminotransferase class V-fold PLP-dependent enzyme [Terriglobales bacterium]
MDDPLLRFRSEFPILERTTYLISNSLGAMPRAAAAGLKEYTEAWATRGVRAWEETWWMLAGQVGDQIAALLNAPPASVSLHTNVTQCQAVVASCLPPAGERGRDTVVVSELEFPSVIYFWERQPGVRLVRIKSEDGGISVPLDRFLTAIDERTLAVPVSHVLFRSARVQDVAAIVRRAHEVGAVVIADVFQSLGCGVPVDVAAWGVDFATGAVLKWLCGGPGTAYLYVRPDLATTLTPRLTGWSAHENPFAFDPGPMRYTTGGYRFLNGTPNIPGMYAARPGLRLITAAGQPAIREKSLRMTERIIALADQRGWPVHAPRVAAERGGTVAINPPNAQQVCATLLERDVIVDWRPGAGIRVAPHFYNREAEVETFFAACDEVVAGKPVTRAAAKPPAFMPTMKSALGKTAAGRWSWIALPSACLLALLLLIVWGREQGLEQRARVQQAQLSTAQRQSRDAVAQLGILRVATNVMSAPATKIVTVKAAPGAPGGEAYLNDLRGAVLVANNLPPAGDQHTYELWLLPRSGNPVPAGSFQASSAGDAIANYPHPLNAVTGLAVSLEPSGGSPQPTGAILLAARLPQ